MNFVKGILIGSAVTAGVVMMCSDGMINKRKMIKKGKNIMRKMF